MFSKKIHPQRYLFGRFFHNFSSTSHKKCNFVCSWLPRHSREHLNMKVYILKETDKTWQINDLLRTLAPSMPEVSPERLHELLHNNGFRLFVAEDTDGALNGMLTLTCCQTLARSKYWIEDVIVAPKFRGKGIGRALVEAAVKHVKEAEGQASIYLTSNPSRQAARALYRSVGFEDYDTGVFKMEI